MATDINTLAQKCGVSKATISRVFTGKARVSDELRARILQTARELNYRPQQVMARDCVAIVVHDLPNPNRSTSFSERLLTSAIFEITRRNLLTEIISIDELPKLYNSYTKAVLLLLSEPQIEAHQEEFRQLAMPILTVNKQYAFSSSVNTDHGEGVRLALEHLFENGHRRIGITIDRLDNQAGRERLGAYSAFMAAHGLDRLPVAEYCVETPEGLSPELTRLLAGEPTALIVCGEGVALRACHELQRRGRRIPDDLSLITSELAGVSCWVMPELTTIDQDLDALAAATVGELTNRIRNPKTPLSATWLPTTLIRRGSVKNINPTGEEFPS